MPNNGRVSVLAAQEAARTRLETVPDPERWAMESPGGEERVTTGAGAPLPRHGRGLGILQEVSQHLAASLDLETVLQATTDGVTRLYGLDTAAVYLVEGGGLSLRATTPPLPPDFPEALRAAALADHPRVRLAIESGSPQLLPDAAAADLTPAERAVVELRGLRTVIYLPLIADVKVVGALIVGSVGEPRAIGAAGVDLCRTLANLSALAVENALLYRDVRRHAAELELLLAERQKAERERLELERRLLHSQKLESLGVLAGGIAHDFNNLLMAIVGNLDLALLKLPAGSPALENIRDSSQAARRATDLTRQLLAYSGKGAFVVRREDVNGLVEENVRLFRTAVGRTAELRVNLAHGLPPVEADAGQVQQVVMNLLTNAAEALDEAPGTIYLSTGVLECDATCLQRGHLAGAASPGRFVCLEVADTGCGMDDQTQQRLFDPFFTTKKAGRGLGMSAILGIVRGHRGAVFVDSAPGRGTTIRVLLPAAAGEAAPEPRSEAGGAAGSSRPAPGGALLVVDDEPDVRAVCKAMAVHLGWKVFTAADGRQALALFRERSAEIAAVVLDLTMPVMNGMVTLRELRRIRPDLKVVLASGFDKSEALKGEDADEVTGFIQKPFSLEQLRRALEQAGDAP